LKYGWRDAAALAAVAALLAAVIVLNAFGVA